MLSTHTEGRVVKFGRFEVTRQVFLTTPHCFGLVNLKPLLPGHVLICPLKQHKRLTDLSAPELSDLFSTVQLTQRLLARAYFETGEPEAGSFSVAVQDGPDAGQTVPHVHVHVIPRKKDDLPQPDEIYLRMAEEEGNVGGALWDRDQRPKPSGGLPRVEDAERSPRISEDMNEEADRYKALLKEMNLVD